MEEKGHIVTIFGRTIPVPNIYSTDKQKAAEAERFGINALIQDPSSDYTLLGGLNVIEAEDYVKEECRASMFIHDAIIWEVDLGYLDKYAKLITNKMVEVDTKDRFGFELTIPFVANAEYGFNLKDVKEYEFIEEE
jgi:DNA polymerase-1